MAERIRETQIEEGRVTNGNVIDDRVSLGSERLTGDVGVAQGEVFTEREVPVKILTGEQLREISLGVWEITQTKGGIRGKFPALDLYLGKLSEDATKKNEAFGDRRKLVEGQVPRSLAISIGVNELTGVPPIGKRLGGFVGDHLEEEEKEIMWEILVDSLSFSQGFSEGNPPVASAQEIIDGYDLLRACFCNLRIGDPDSSEPQPPPADLFGQIKLVQNGDLSEYKNRIITRQNVRLLSRLDGIPVGLQTELEKVVDVDLPEERFSHLASRVLARYGFTLFGMLTQPSVDRTKLVLSAQAMHRFLNRQRETDQASHIMEELNPLVNLDLGPRIEERNSDTYALFQRACDCEVSFSRLELPPSLSSLGNKDKTVAADLCVPGCVKEYVRGRDIYRFTSEDIGELTLEQIVARTLDRWQKLSLSESIVHGKPLDPLKRTLIQDRLQEIFGLGEDGFGDIVRVPRSFRDFSGICEHLEGQLQEIGITRCLGEEDADGTVGKFIVADVLRRWDKADSEVVEGIAPLLRDSSRLEDLVIADQEIRSNIHEPPLTLSEAVERSGERPRFTIGEIEKRLKSECPGQDKAVEEIARWLYSQVVGGMNRRLLMVVGERGSGKSTIGRAIGKVTEELMGESGAYDVRPVVVPAIAASSLSPTAYVGVHVDKRITEALVEATMRYYDVSGKEAVELINNGKVMGVVPIEEMLARLLTKKNGNGGSSEGPAEMSKAVGEQLRTLCENNPPPVSIRMGEEDVDINLRNVLFIGDGSFSEIREGVKLHEKNAPYDFSTTGELVSHYLQSAGLVDEDLLERMKVVATAKVSIESAMAGWFGREFPMLQDHIVEEIERHTGTKVDGVAFEEEATEVVRKYLVRNLSRQFRALGDASDAVIVRLGEIVGKMSPREILHRFVQVSRDEEGQVMEHFVIDKELVSEALRV